VKLKVEGKTEFDNAIKKMLFPCLMKRFSVVLLLIRAESLKRKSGNQPSFPLPAFLAQENFRRLRARTCESRHPWRCALAAGRHPASTFGLSALHTNGGPAMRNL
jgi:hypothetical protein